MPHAAAGDLDGDGKLSRWEINAHAAQEVARRQEERRRVLSGLDEEIAAEEAASQAEAAEAPAAAAGSAQDGPIDLDADDADRFKKERAAGPLRAHHEVPLEARFS